jgi:hypothetical protein
VTLRHACCFLVIVTGCTRPKPAAPTGPNVVTITATEYAFGAPDTIPAGLTTLRMLNPGREPHQAFLAGGQGKSFAELEAAMMKEGPLPEWLTIPIGAGVVVSGDSSIVTANLPPGNYLILCFISSPDGTPHVAKGMSRRIVVTAAPAGAVAAPEPKADVTITLNDYSFTTSTPLTAGTHTIRVENSGPQLHELTIERLAPGKTVADFRQWVGGGMRGLPPVASVGGFAGLDKGKVGWLTITLTPGNYLLNCYVPDAKDGKPHFVHGMVQQITIS